MVSKSALLGLGLVMVAAAGCKPDEPGEPINRTKLAEAVVDAICGPFKSCDCEDGAAIDDADDCDDAMRPIVEAAAANAADLALRYHGECVARVNRYFDELDCDASDEVDEDDVAAALYEVSLCKLVSGQGSRGQPCELIGGPSFELPIGDTCGHNLFCDGTLCRPFPRKRGDYCGGAPACPPGLRCLDPEGDGVATCENPAGEDADCNPHDFAPCDTDLYCDPEDAECKELPGEGDNCLLGLCQEGLSCLTGICESLPGVGEMCPEGVCDPEEAFCDFAGGQVCAALPGKGEACPQGQCGEGLECGPEQVCIERPAVICSVATAVGLCLYVDDGICDEPDIGTGLCPEGTDPFDCQGVGDDTFDPTLPPTTTFPGTTTFPTSPTTTLPPTATDVSITDTLTATDTGTPATDESGATFGN